MTRRPPSLPAVLLPLLLGLAVWPRGAAAQLASGDSAWAAGDFHAARIAYEQALAADPQPVRAVYRLGILASWDGRLDSALALVRRARQLEPQDADIRVTEARILAWAGRYRGSLARYDSILAEFPGHAEAGMERAQTLAWSGDVAGADAAYAAMLDRDPGNVEARVGRAQLASWQGDFAAAIQGYEEALQDDPRHAGALAGLAQVYLWQGRISRAREYADLALAADPSNRPAHEVADAVRAELRPRLEPQVGWSNDSDHNTNFWQTLSVSVYLADGIRGFGSVGLTELADRFRDATRLAVEGGASYAVGNGQITGALGARQLSPSGADGRTVATWRLGASYRFAPSVTGGAGYARYSFDETALLASGALDVDALEGGVDVKLRPGLTASAGGGLAWLSDGNSRRSGVVAVTREFGRQFFAGVLARVLGYGQPGAGYFTPDRFVVAEVRGGYSFSRRPWSARITSGLGIQQVLKGASLQSEWHVEVRGGRTWGPGNTIELFGGISNSAESSTTGAFRWRTAGIVVRFGI